jgi:hypothetical protein
MKKIFKSRLLYFILGIVIASGVSTAFAYTLMAPDVGFEPTEELWDVNDTGEALDDLYRIITTNAIDNYDNKTYTSEGIQSYDNRNTIISGGYYIDAHNYVWVNITFKFNRNLTQGTWLQMWGFPEMGDTDFITTDVTGKMAFKVHHRYSGDSSRFNRITYVGQESEIYTLPVNTPVTLQFKYLKGS